MTPIVTRPSSPIQRLSNAYLRKNAVANRISATAAQPNQRRPMIDSNSCALIVRAGAAVENTGGGTVGGVCTGGGGTNCEGAAAAGGGGGGSRYSCASGRSLSGAGATGGLCPSAASSRATGAVSS